MTRDSSVQPDEGERGARVVGAGRDMSDGSRDRVAALFDISPTTVGKMHEECHETPAGDDTIYQGRPCAHCGDRIKLSEITESEPYEVPTNEDGDGFCSTECRERGGVAVSMGVIR